MVRLLDVRVVVDTNTILQGLLNPHGASGHVLERCESRDVTTLLSRPILSEYRYVLSSVEIKQRFPNLSDDTITMTIERLSYIAEKIAVKSRFLFHRDPRDAMFLELAIAGYATDLITVDPDLLSLNTGYDDAAKRLRNKLPGLQILTPATFLKIHFPI